MEAKILKVLVALGIPGVALGIFYLLFNKFEFKFSEVGATWTAAIVVLFIVAITGVTFFSLYKWSPSKVRTPGNDAQELVFQVKEERITYDVMVKSLRYDVVKIHAYTHYLGIAAESYWIKHKYPEAKIVSQSLTTLDRITKDEKNSEIYFDIIKMKFPDGREKDIYFDISEFFDDATSILLNHYNANMASKLAKLYR